MDQATDMLAISLATTQPVERVQRWLLLRLLQPRRRSVLLHAYAPCRLGEHRHTLTLCVKVRCLAVTRPVGAVHTADNLPTEPAHRQPIPIVCDRGGRAYEAAEPGEAGRFVRLAWPNAPVSSGGLQGFEPGAFCNQAAAWNATYA